MDERVLEQSTAKFGFKRIQTKQGVTFRQIIRREGSKEGMMLDIEHNGHDHVALVFRSLYETPAKRQGNRCVFRWTMDSKATVQMASVLFLLAERYMRDSDEEPYIRIVDAERAGFGPNWINEDYATAVARTERRKARSHLFGLMKRCVETCADDAFIQFLAVNLAMWAAQTEDGFTEQKAEQMLFQLGMVPEKALSS